MIPLFPYKHITPETCSYSHAAIYSNSSVTGGKKERIKFAFVDYFCSDLISWTWKQFCNLCTGTLHLLEFACYLFRDEAHPIIHRRLRWWWWGSCLWGLVERLWRSFEKEWSLPFVSCASLDGPRAMQQRFFFLLLMSSISSNSCRSGCASSKIDGDLPVRPSWPFWEVDASPNSPVFASKQFLVYLTATAFCLRDNFWILTNCFSFLFLFFTISQIRVYSDFREKKLRKRKR